MEERIMTNEQFRAILDLVIQVVKDSETAEEILNKLQAVRKNFGGDRNEKD
jgi:hypothetical protein